MGTILRIVSWPYRMVTKNAVAMIDEIKGNTTFRKMLYSMSLLPLGGSIVMFLVAIISFIIQNGFGQQVELMKSGLWDAISSSSKDTVWTTGTSGYFYNMLICIAVGAVFLAMTVFAAIDLFKEGSNGRKIAFTICGILLLGGVGTLVFGLVALVDAVVVPLIGLGVTVITGIACIVILSMNDYYLSSVINTIFFMVIAPFTVLVIENILGIVAFVLALVVMGIAFMIFGSALGSTSSSSAPAASSEDPMKARERRKKEERMTKLSNEIKQHERNVEGHAKKELGYFYVDTKYNVNQAAKKRKELEQLRAQA